MEIVKTEVSSAGFQGVLYPAGGRKDKVVITLSGSEGGLRYAQKMARLHAERGIPALAVAYFGTKETCLSLSQVPLEYIEHAIRWLKQQGYQRIAVEGLSKGTEYALAAATTFSDLSCVILKTPTWYYGEGLIQKTPSHTSCWTYRGTELPYTPYRERAFHLKRSILRAREYNILPINTGKEIVGASVIPIEKVHGPILILSTEADTVWPSAESGRRLDARLARSNFPYPHRHICFTHMSHIMLENADGLVRLLFHSEREYPKECAEERSLMEQAVTDWLEHIW